MKFYAFPVILLMLFFVSCSDKKSSEIDVSDIDVNTEVVRFDQKFYTTPPEGLAALKKEFPYFFPLKNPDSVWINKMKNKDEQELFAETQKLYKDFSAETQKLNDLFKHIKYYFPKFHEPRVITLLSNIDSDNRVILTDSLLLISLDVYLGKDNQIYSDYPKYIKQNFNTSHMIVDVAALFADKILRPSDDKSFVSRIVQEGKKLELIHHFLPEVSENEIMGYTADQMKWADENEAEIWKYFIENLMIYSSDPELSPRFIEEAPFSKFYIANDQESPGRIGTWFGWQIVRSYMKHNDSDITGLIKTPNEKVFKRSKYKPRK